LIRTSGSIDIYVISAETVQAPTPDRRGWWPHRPWRRYAQSALLVLGATAIGAPFSLHFAPTNLVMLYLVTVVIAAVYLGRGPSILASVLAVLAFDFFFVPPKLTFSVADTQYILTFIGLFVVSLVISSLAAQAREQAEAARHRESQTAELYALSRDLAGVFGIAEIVEAVVRHVERTFDRQAIVLLPQEGRLVSPVESPVVLDPNEEAVADWVYRRGEPAGRNTNTLPAASLRYLPLMTARGTIGVLGIAKPLASESFLTPEQHRLMEAFASQAAMAVDRAGYAEQARKSEVLQATEQLQAALLNSISHDLRTPLVSITGALSSLEGDGDSMPETYRKSLIENAREEAERLNRLVGDLLDMTRLEAGAMKVRLQPSDVQDVIGSALTQLEQRLDRRQVQVRVPDDLPSVPLDFALVSQVLVNLLDNALKYSPPESPIEVEARLRGAFLEIEIADRGTGIPPEDLTRIFDKFYRVRHPGSVSGTGLGLSICKGIVEAHRGFIVAENRPGGGSAITVALPAG
jgi:two-component system sensor histidine kinase KdpD